MKRHSSTYKWMEMKLTNLDLEVVSQSKSFKNILMFRYVCLTLNVAFWTKRWIWAVVNFAFIAETHLTGCILLVSVQFSHSVLSDIATPWTAARLASRSITNSQSLPKLMYIELVMLSTHLILCRPLIHLPSRKLASGSLQISQLSASGGQTIVVSASASVLPMNTWTYLL